MGIKNKIIELIFKDTNSTIDYLVDSEEILEINIFDDLGYDSIRFIELVVDIESEFQIEIDSELLVMKNFSTISQITENIEVILKRGGEETYA